MKRTVIAAVLLLGTLAAAQAKPIDTYLDLIRPHGHKRSATVFNADIAACYRQTGANRFHHESPAFKQCMLSRGYRWLSVRHVPDPRTRRSEPDTSYYDPGPPASDPQPAPAVTTTIDPFTGEVLAQ
jgi:hypothetical protein